MRRLWSIPIFHSEIDLGGLGVAVRNRKIEQMGWKGWRESTAQVAKTWDLIETTLGHLPGDLTAFRIYQDSLPVCGKEIEIAEELAAKGSRNFKLIKELVSRGAALMGTEDPQLLIKQLHAVKAHQPDQHFSEQDLMRERDEFIGKRISSTLLEGETGLLFLGHLHSAEPFLAPDIVREFPLKESWPADG